MLNGKGISQDEIDILLNLELPIEERLKKWDEMAARKSKEEQRQNN